MHFKPVLFKGQQNIQEMMTCDSICHLCSHRQEVIVGNDTLKVVITSADAVPHLEMGRAIPSSWSGELTKFPLACAFRVLSRSLTSQVV